MSGFEINTTIRRPAAEVFTYMLDIANEKHWRDGVVSMTHDNDIVGAPGASFTQTLSILGAEMAVHITITEVVARMVIGYAFEGGPMSGKGSYSIVDKGDECALIGAIDLGKGVMAKTMGGMFRGRFENDLDHLKTLLEA